jgi:hypothetical protein
MFEQLDGALKGSEIVSRHLHRNRAVRLRTVRVLLDNNRHR